MAAENAVYNNGMHNGNGVMHKHGGSDVERGNAGIGAAMSPQEEDRFERFAAAMAANNKLRDASRVNALRCAAPTWQCWDIFLEAGSNDSGRHCVSERQSAAAVQGG